MKRLRDRGFSHILAILLVLIVVVAGTGWYVYSRQSKDNSTNSTEKVSQQKENLQTSSDEYKSLMNELNDQFMVKSGINLNPPKYKEDTATKIKMSEYVTTRILKGYEWYLQGNYENENIINEIFNEVGLEKNEGDSTEYQNNIAFCKLNLYDFIVGSTRVSCIERKAKDEVLKFSNEAFTTFKSLEIYKNLPDKNIALDLIYNASPDNTSRGIVITFPVMGYGRNVFMYKDSSTWKLVLAQSTAIEDALKPLSTSECETIASKDYKGVFDFYLTYCKKG